MEFCKRSSVWPDTSCIASFSSNYTKMLPSSPPSHFDDSLPHGSVPKHCFNPSCPHVCGSLRIIVSLTLNQLWLCPSGHEFICCELWTDSPGSNTLDSLQLPSCCICHYPVQHDIISPWRSCARLCSTKSLKDEHHGQIPSMSAILDLRYHEWILTFSVMILNLLWICGRQANYDYIMGSNIISNFILQAEQVI
jgi:hypothetical protein